MKSFARFLCSLLLVSIFTNCGANSGPANAPNPGPVQSASAPTVTAISPAAGGTAVPLNTAVKATFSTAMDAATITSSTFYILGASGNVTYDAGSHTATLTPSSPLQANTSYSGKITSAVADSSGTHMQNDYSFNFTTAANAPAGGGGGTGSGGGSGGGTGGGNAAAQDLIYVTNQTSESVSGWLFDSASNTATATPGSPYPSDVGPSLMEASPDGKFLYVAMSEMEPGVRGTNCSLAPIEVISYAIDHGSGALTVVQRLNLQKICAAGMTMDKAGKYLYVSASEENTGNGYIEGIALDGMGHMSELPGSPYAVGKQLPGALALSPDGKYLYSTPEKLINDNTSLVVYSRDTTTGAIQYQSSLNNGSQRDLAISPSGTTLITTGFDSLTVTSYTVDATSGAVTPAASVTVPAAHVWEVAIDATGTYATVASDSGVYMYSIGQGGTLTAVSGAPFGTTVRSVSFDPSGQYLSALNPVASSTQNQSEVTVYKVNHDTGALTKAAGGLQTQSFSAEVLMLAK